MGLMMLSVFTRYWKPLAAAVMALAIIATVLLYGSHKYDQGVRDEQSEQAAQAIGAAKSRGAVDDAVSRLPDGGALSELRRD
jgi:2-polyprenyl-3-methyl-5-hydroxy-6-metoxy-1,4-benzoquinol methylase